MKKKHSHDEHEVKSKIEEIKMYLKRQTENSPQAVKKIYKDDITAL